MTYLLSYFMGCIAVVRCVLVLRCGLAGVVWYPDAGFSNYQDDAQSNKHKTQFSSHHVTSIYCEILGASLLIVFQEFDSCPQYFRTVAGCIGAVFFLKGRCKFWIIG